MQRWQFWIDRGGTFTDVVGRDPDGSLHTEKLLSDDPQHYQDAVIEGIRRLLGSDHDAGIEAVRMGTTVATNALLERRGEPAVLVVTKGFGDALRIGYQNRPDLFALNIQLPEVLYARVIECNERIDAAGEVLEPLDEPTLCRDLAEAKAAGFNSVAIVFLHGYRHSRHELLAAELARAAGFDQISVSHEVSPLMKLVARGDTTVADAYLSPILRRYIDSVERNLPGSAEQPALLFMQSHGGLTEAHRFRGKDAILSGPAGGVVGMVRTGLTAGFERLVGFDMGGTSTDVSLFDGVFERSVDNIVAGVRIQAPMMNIHTIAAGGGSILRFSDARFQVGPESAGADPGPACYRRGGPPTVTDANVLLGRIQPDYFPRVFGKKADEPIHVRVVEDRFETLRKKIAAETGNDLSPEEVAEGFLRVAIERMAGAVKMISTQRGFDVTEFVLSCFGGAAGQHACGVADLLGIETILVHPFAGVLSAYGMGLADIRAIREATIEKTLETGCLGVLSDKINELEVATRKELLQQNIAEARLQTTRSVFLRYDGTDTALEVVFDSVDTMQTTFAIEHQRRFGFTSHGRSLIVERVRVEAIGSIAGEIDPVLPETKTPTPQPEATRAVRMQGVWEDASFYGRETLRPGHSVDAPAVIIEANATTIVEPGWRAQVTRRNHLLLERVTPAADREAIGTDADPVMLEVFNNLFMHIAEQMGAVLQNTAQSVNIKERLDYSCAVFDKDGLLVANAPHMPVHLGSMGESVQTVLRLNQDVLCSGDVYMLNAPYNGGTHLPDITVVTPVFDDGRLVFFVASRAHHADIGGTTPGSMPPNSRHIDEEGVVFDNFRIVSAGHFAEEELRERLLSGPYPARNPDQNTADVKAQVAANERGIAELKKAIAHFGRDTVHAYMAHVQDNAEESVRRVLDVLNPGAFSVELDNGATVSVRVDIDRNARRAKIDFTGTSAQLDDNFNAPASISKAAVLYVFRTLVPDPIPLNAGCLKPLELIIPEGSMLNPVHPAAVVAGNVETSQCVTDALYGALGVLAAAQGTMNNFTFGDETKQYYETVCGGCGAGDGFDGASAVHTHMTNSRLTDTEVLEWRYPVLVRDFSIRKGSGGSGCWSGGDGVIRRIEFREPMTAAILSNRRRVAPFGITGGNSAAAGKNYVIRADGKREALAATARVDMQPGDQFVIETPGGGGYGTP